MEWLNLLTGKADFFLTNDIGLKSISNLTVLVLDDIKIT